MGRLLVLIALVVLVVWLVKRALRSGNPPPKALWEGELVKCAHCGVHLPRGEAREAGGALFCSDEHARLGRR